MDNIFEFTKHNILWLHMAEYYTIEKLAYETRNKDKFLYVCINVEKSQYALNMFNDYNMDDSGMCYACRVCNNCINCPIDIGVCSNFDSLYKQYEDMVLRYAYTNKKEYREEAHKIALQIANAPKNENTSIEYIWR